MDVFQNECRVLFLCIRGVRLDPTRPAIDAALKTLVHTTANIGIMSKAAQLLEVINGKSEVDLRGTPEECS